MNKSSWLGPLLFVFCFSTVLSCLESEDAFDTFAQYRKDTTAIGSYVRANENGMLVVKDSSGIYLRIETVGDRLPAALASNQVTTAFVGRLFPEGETFDASSEYTTYLNKVIPGWTRAFQLLPQGSTADIFIPSVFAYGRYAQGPVPGNSIVQFHVDLTKVKYTAAEKSKLTSDTTAIADYLSDNSIEAARDSSGVMYVITEEGTGEIPSWYDRIVVSYKISTLISGTLTVVKDFGTTTPVSIYGRERVIDYINGVKAILLKMKEGSKATLYIPSGMAYGPADYYEPSDKTSKLISANTNVVVELHLIEVN